MKNIKFEIGFVYLMSNDDYVSLLRNIFNTLDTITIDNEHVNNIIEYTRKHLDILNKYLFAPTWHKDTELIRQLNKERRRMLTSMRTVIDGSKHAETEEQQDAAKLLAQWIKSQRKNISSRNAERETTAIESLNNHYKEDPEIKKALKILSLHGRFSAIVKHHYKVVELENVRAADKRGNEHNSKERRRESQEDLRRMLDAVYSILVLDMEGNQEVYKVCLMIDGLIRDANRIHKFRKTINKKRRAKAANLLQAKKKRNKRKKA